MNVKSYRQQVEASLAAQVRQVPQPPLALTEEPVPSAVAPTAGAPSSNNLNNALAVLNDVDQPGDARKAAFFALQGASFLGGQFAPFHARYIDVLRRLTTDPDARLRRLVLDALSNLKDDFARQKLTDSLQGRSEPLVPPAVALGFLARDDHGAAHQIAWEWLNTQRDTSLREQAIRVLGSDPSAVSFLSKAMTNKDEFRAVRRASAVALRGLDPERFQRLATDILRDTTDFQDIRASVAGVLQRTGTSSDLQGGPPAGPDAPAARKRLRQRRP